ncbi:MAG TPA: ABC transporter ATP-binding protein, partial [Thermoplasmata archaeon]|nr:ABC transporter ATP-binding protein [Thermoplasmata archaeon]
MSSATLTVGRPAQGAGDGAIVARQLSKRYGTPSKGTDALRDVDLTIPEGRIYGLIGRNGAGKTTFVRIAATQLLPTSGSLTVLGHDVRTEARTIRLSIAAVPQESRPLYFLNVDELVFLYLRMRGMERREARRRTDSVLEELSLTPHRKRLVSMLSGGMRRRAMVAMVLASDADVFFLDEPTTGLDPCARREVWASIRRAKREQRTVLLTTHYLDEAEALSDRLALLDGGVVKLEGTPAD